MTQCGSWGSLGETSVRYLRALGYCIDHDRNDACDYAICRVCAAAIVRSPIDGPLLRRIAARHRNHCEGCRHCFHRRADHADGKCLFEPTHYEPPEEIS